MAATLNEYIQKHPCQGFTLGLRYFRVGDFATFFVSDESCHARRVDELLTVYVSNDSDKLVGCKIKGVKRLVSEIGAFGVEVKDSPIQLKLLFITGRGTLPNPGNLDQYRELAEAADDMTFDPSELQPA